MKNIILIFGFLITSIFGFSQTNGINYKALIKDNLGNVVANQSITVQLSILQGVAQTNVYQETQTPTTDLNGIVILTIGEGTTSDDFSTINWNSDYHFLNVQINTGSGLTDMGTTQFKTVPYALSAANVTGLEAIDEGNGVGWRLKGRDPANYDDLGFRAVDLSASTSASEVFGASGNYTTAMGVNTTASGAFSTAIGNNSIASGSHSTAMGFHAEASEISAIAIGSYAIASGISSTAIGSFTEASGQIATAMGSYTEASGQTATAMGNYTLASGVSATAMGSATEATGNYATTMGFSTIAAGSNSTAMGLNTEALGFSSVAMGYGTTASGYTATAIGRNNIGGGNAIAWVETDPLFEVGNGASISNKANAFSILKNGTITAPSFDLAEITDDKALITKEYADTNLGSSGLEAIDEGNGIGWRIKTNDPANYGNIGNKAVDLSYNNVPSTTKGASGAVSTAMGYITEASGNYSTAIGILTTASGDASTAIGFDTRASSLYSTSIGVYNIGGGNPTSWIETDPLFEIGNSAYEANRDNALTILKNGKVGIGNHQPAGFLEVKAVNTGSQPNLNLIHEGTTGARINFSNTDTTNGNVWTFYGDTNDTNANSVFNIYHPNAPSNGNILQIKGDGLVGINGAPDADFHLFHGNNGIASGMKLENSSNNAWWRFYVSSGSDDLRLYSASQGTTIIGAFDDITGAYTSTSDRRLKKNIKDLHFNWTDFMKLETLNYQYKAQKDTKEYIGLIAQDVEPIYPELVNYNEDSDVYHLNYSGFGVIAIKAVQEQQKIIQSQQLRIEVLEAQLIEKDDAYKALSSRIETIETFLKTSEK